MARIKGNVIDDVVINNSDRDAEKILSMMFGCEVTVTFICRYDSDSRTVSSFCDVFMDGYMERRVYL